MWGEKKVQKARHQVLTAARGPTPLPFSWVWTMPFLKDPGNPKISPTISLSRIANATNRSRRD